ncbi:kinase-like protein [Canariomyces notabilis]|uniref:Kinase-like protein n=1 Tax=Canariomyces notabilis TaxID=2074819 RepID=A0AAN6YVL8_9PEZI|nr:kinase-like protein [Canariomyces arenarius]
MWWDNDTIDRTVTRSFVCSHLIPAEIERLDRPLGFGDGLTDGTYWEWIDEKAKRIFLLLVDFGMPDQIFGLIDNSWGDEDLPIALDQVGRLGLPASKDGRFERRFFARQFHYLLRPLQKGEHLFYQEDDVVPLDVFDKKHVSSQSQHADKVVLPNQPGMVFCRRRIPLGPGHLSHEDFLCEIDGIKNVQNVHLLSYWASYFHREYGYVIFTPAADFSLKSLLSSTPSNVKNMDKKDRRQLVIDWIHCLVDTLCYIHSRGLSHGNIKPSTVLFTSDNHVLLSDFTRLNADLWGSGTDNFDKEAYDYAAPEQWFRPTSAATDPAHRTATDRGHKNAPTPHLNPQAADVFSLGCIILDLLSFLLKKHGRPFAAHRAAKPKGTSRGGAVRDSSFHKNLGQVESWMTQLARDAAKKEEPEFRGMLPMLHVVERMLAPHPSDRPAAKDVQARMYQIITESCGISEPHCVHQYGGWDFGIGNLKLGPPTLEGGDGYDLVSIPTRRYSNPWSGNHRRNGSSGGSARASSSGSGSQGLYTR